MLVSALVGVKSYVHDDGLMLLQKGVEKLLSDAQSDGAEEVPDKVYLRLVKDDPYMARLHPDTVLGEATDVINGGEEACRDHACQYGIFVARALREYGIQQGHGTQIAMINAGSIAGSLPQGQITAKDIAKIHPFGNRAIFTELPGNAIVREIQMGLEEHGEGQGTDGSWLQVSGLKFAAKWNGAKWQLEKVIVNVDNSADLGQWEAIDPSKSYMVATNTYVMTGKEGRGIFKDKDAPLDIQEDEKSVLGVVADYIRREGTVSPPEVDNRELFLREGVERPAWVDLPNPTPGQGDAEEQSE
jgi:2',3'-cyclic-nucleotide 2'-phosphodiesterase (5'-nucleotidase family)